MAKVIRKDHTDKNTKRTKDTKGLLFQLKALVWVKDSPLKVVMDNFNVAKIAKDNVKSDDWLKVKRKLDFSSANEPPPEGTNLRREIIERMVKVPTEP